MSMDREKIFVVVPVYNVEPYLERCVDSILNQTYDNFELVLVDDGSPDNCPAICDRYAAEYENITVIHQENGGLSAARNTGIDYAFKNGNSEQDWISFIDSDDFVHPKYMEYLYRAAKEAGVEVSSCAYIRTDTSNISDKDMPFAYTAFSPEEFWHKDRTNATIAWGKLYRLNNFLKKRYPVGKIHEDEFTTYRIIFTQAKIAFIPLRLYNYYSNTIGITQSQWSPKRLQQLDALEAQVNYFRDKNFHIACTESIAHLLQHGIKHVMYIKHLSPKYNHLLKDVKARRNRAFWLYVKEVGFRKAVSYWYEVRIKTPLKRVLGKESVLSFLKRKIKKKLHMK